MMPNSAKWLRKAFSIIVRCRDSSLRVRCSIDWLLRPQQRAHLPATSFVAGTINYYVSTSDSWMEVASAAL